VQQGRAARDRFEKAARMKRRIGLAKVYRSWRAATERGHVEEKAARAERAMLQLALARTFHGWFANIDTEAEQNAAKANRAMRTLGLAHALRQWRAQTDPHAKMAMAKAVRAMRQLSLAKAMRAWVAATDTKAEQNAAKAVRAMRQLGMAKAMRAWREAYESACIHALAMRALCALQQQGLARAMRAWMESTEHLTLAGKVMRRALARWRGGELRVGFRLWAAMRLATRAMAMLLHKQRRGWLQRGFADLCAASGQLSRLQKVMARCMQAWTRQSLHSGFVKLRHLCSSEAVLAERVGRIMMGIQVRALSFGFGELNAHRLERRLAEMRLGSVYGFGRLGAFRRAWSAIEVASGMTQLAVQRGRSALILLRRLQLDDAWLQWSRLRARRGRTRKLRQQSNYLYAMHKIPSMLALWRRRAHERRLLWLGLTSHKVVQFTEAFGRIKQCATCRVNVARALQLALAFLRGSTHAGALHRWRWHRACKLEVSRLGEVADRYRERSLLRRVMFVLHCTANVRFGVAVAAEQTVEKVRVRHLAWAFARARAHQRARRWSAEASTTTLATTLRFALHRWSGLAIKVKRVKAEKKALREAEAEAKEEAARVERARLEAEAKQARREAAEALMREARAEAERKRRQEEAESRAREEARAAAARAAEEARVAAAWEEEERLKRECERLKREQARAAAEKAFEEARAAAEKAFEEQRAAAAREEEERRAEARAAERARAAEAAKAEAERLARDEARRLEEKVRREEAARVEREQREMARAAAESARAEAEAQRAAAEAEARAAAESARAEAEAQRAAAEAEARAAARAAIEAAERAQAEAQARAELAKAEAAAKARAKALEAEAQARAAIEAAERERAAAEAARQQAAAVAAATAKAKALEEEAQRLRDESERASMLEELITGCASEISERQMLLGQWSINAVTGHAEYVGPGDAPNRSSHWDLPSPGPWDPFARSNGSAHDSANGGAHGGGGGAHGGAHGQARSQAADASYAEALAKYRSNHGHAQAQGFVNHGHALAPGFVNHGHTQAQGFVNHSRSAPAFVNSMPVPMAARSSPASSLALSQFRPPSTNLARESTISSLEHAPLRNTSCAVSSSADSHLQRRVEQQAPTTDLFATIDRNGDGHIDRAEWNAAVAHGPMWRPAPAPSEKEQVAAAAEAALGEERRAMLSIMRSSQLSPFTAPSSSRAPPYTAPWGAEAAVGAPPRAAYNGAWEQQQQPQQPQPQPQPQPPPQQQHASSASPSSSASRPPVRPPNHRSIDEEIAELKQWVASAQRASESAARARSHVPMSPKVA